MAKLQGVAVAAADETWIAHLTPAAGSSVELLLAVPIGLDVWERRAHGLVVAATESQLAELERRRLAEVERWSTRDEYETRMRARSGEDDRADDSTDDPGDGGPRTGTGRTRS